MSDAVITVTCPHCNVRGTVPAALLGKSVRCPECKNQVPVIRRDAPPAPVPPAPRSVPDREPECYGKLLSLTDRLATFCGTLVVIGLVLCIVGFGVALTAEGKAGEPAMVGTFVVGVQLVAGMVLVILGQRVVQVFVDLARNVRGIRFKVEQGD